MVNCYSSGKWQLEQTAAMLFPRKTVKRSRLRGTVTTDVSGRIIYRVLGPHVRLRSSCGNGQCGRVLGEFLFMQ
jgi:hypothetical protein